MGLFELCILQGVGTAAAAPIWFQLITLTRPEKIALAALLSLLWFVTLPVLAVLLAVAILKTPRGDW
jgi:hypothetical protein